jgi:hypothetical protein
MNGTNSTSMTVIVDASRVVSSVTVYAAGVVVVVDGRRVTEIVVEDIGGQIEVGLVEMVEVLEVPNVLEAPGHFEDVEPVQMSGAHEQPKGPMPEF